MRTGLLPAATTTGPAGHSGATCSLLGRLSHRLAAEVVCFLLAHMQLQQKKVLDIRGSVLLNMI